MIIGRLTGQAGKSRLTFNYEYQKRCEGTPLQVETRGATTAATTGSALATTHAFQSPEATSTAARGYFECRST